MARLSAVVLALAAPAGALVAPAAPKATVKVQGVSDMIGGTIETAGLWDPLRLSDGASDEQLHRWRCVELKHGRVAMAATVGYLYNDLQLNFPGTLSPSASLKFADVPTGLAATHGFPNTVPIAGWVQIIGFIGVLETTTFKQDPAKEAGNVGGDLFRRYRPRRARDETHLGAQERAPRHDGHHGHAGHGPAHGHGPDLVADQGRHAVRRRRLEADVLGLVS